MFKAGSAFSRLVLGEALCILSLSSAGHGMGRPGRREVVRTIAGRKRAVWVECLELDSGSSQMGHSSTRKTDEQRKKRKTEICKYSVRQ